MVLEPVRAGVGVQGVVRRAAIGAEVDPEIVYVDLLVGEVVVVVGGDGDAVVGVVGDRVRRAVGRAADLVVVAVGDVLPLPRWSVPARSVPIRESATVDADQHATSEDFLSRGRPAHTVKPALARHLTTLTTDWTRELSDVVTQRLGNDDQARVDAHLAVGALLGALNAAGELWLTSDLQGDPHALMNRATEIVEHGLAGSVEIAPARGRERRPTRRGRGGQ